MKIANDYTVTVENNQNTIILNKGRSNEMNATNSQYLYQICDMDDTSQSCDSRMLPTILLLKPLVMKDFI